MALPGGNDERDKYDHSDHSLERREPDDLPAPGRGKGGREGDSRTPVSPPDATDRRS